MRTFIASDFVTSLRAFAAAAPSRIPSTRSQMAQVHPLAIAHAPFAPYALLIPLATIAASASCSCCTFPLHYFAFFGHGVVQQFRFVAFGGGVSEGALLGLARSIHWHISSTRPRAVHLAYDRAVHS